jgi:hypothetical protein
MQSLHALDAQERLRVYKLERNFLEEVSTCKPEKIQERDDVQEWHNRRYQSREEINIFVCGGVVQMV